MTEKDHLDFLETRLEHLQKEKSETLKALEGVLSVRNIHISLNKLENSEILIDNAYNKMTNLVKLKNAGFFLVEENTGHFTPSRFYPEADKNKLVEEIDRLILDNTFSMAIKSNSAVIIKSKELGSYVMLHVMATVSRTRGVFIAQLDMPKENIPDAVFPLITIIMHDTAHQIESFELYNRNKTANKMLSETVSHLEASERKLRNFNEKLEAEVFNRTKELKETNELLENEITERKKIEKLLMQQKEALQTLNETLENRVQIETENRRKSERILHEQSKLAAMGQMMKAVAHQWRQPLNSLGLLVQDMLDEYDHNGISETYLKDNVDKCLKLLMHMSTTIDEFTELVRTDSGKDYFDIINSAKEVISLLERQYNGLGIFFELRIPEQCLSASDTISIRGDAGMFKQILINLLSNSKDAILERLERSKAEKGSIVIDIKCLGEHTSVEIEDNGGGIPENIIDRVFEPYFTTKKQGKGTGIGLYMSRLVVQEQMQGAITVRNSAAGSVFTITLPSADKQTN